QVKVAVRHVAGEASGPSRIDMPNINTIGRRDQSITGGIIELGVTGVVLLIETQTHRVTGSCIGFSLCSVYTQLLIGVQFTQRITFLQATFPDIILRLVIPNQETTNAIVLVVVFGKLEDLVLVPGRVEGNVPP